MSGEVTPEELLRRRRAEVSWLVPEVPIIPEPEDEDEDEDDGAECADPPRTES